MPTTLQPTDEPRAKDIALELWMQEVTAILCYQPDIPQKHKEDLCKALNEYNMVKGVKTSERPIR